jgi:uncharacterized Zn ribbon protein
MSREVPFDLDAICDGCGKEGAYDFMGDYYCQGCTDRWDKSGEDSKQDYDGE